MTMRGYSVITINIGRTVKLFQGVRRISKWTSATNTKITC